MKTDNLGPKWQTGHKKNGKGNLRLPLELETVIVSKFIDVDNLWIYHEIGNSYGKYVKVITIRQESRKLTKTTSGFN